jgi:hypothetical protein
MPLSSSVHNLARHQRTDVRADRHVIKHQISNLLNCLLTCYLLTFWCRCIAGPWIIFTITHKTGLVRNISRSNNAIVNGELMPHRHIVQLISVAAIYQLNWNKFILNCEKEKNQFPVYESFLCQTSTTTRVTPDATVYSYDGCQFPVTQPRFDRSKGSPPVHLGHSLLASKHYSAR